METIALIGLGRIAKNYTAGIAASKRFSLCAVCDLSPAAASVAEYAAYRHYTDYRELIARERPAWILIATPPKTHYEIAAYALSNGVNVLVEKPATTTAEDYWSLCALAREKKRVFDVMFHWQWGSEVPPLRALCSGGHLGEIQVNIFDPYSDDGVCIRPARVGLCGTWLDSGINALSFVNCLLPFDTYQILAVKAQHCPASGLPLFVEAELLIDGVRVSISVDWREQKNPKFSRLLLDGRAIEVDHMARTVTDGASCVSYAEGDRLLEHYLNLFEHAEMAGAGESTHRIHQILFEVAKQL